MFRPTEAPANSEAALEKRFYPRVVPPAPVNVSFADGRRGDLLNLSENGLLVCSSAALGENFVSRLSLPLHPSAKPIEVCVRVVWGGDSNLAGIQLLDLLDEDREQIRKWIAAKEIHARTPESTAPAEQAAQAPPNPKPFSPAIRKFPIINRKSSRLPVVACAVSALVMLAMALALRGSPVAAWFKRPFTLEMTNTLAMKPGSTVTNPDQIQPPAATPIETASINAPAQNPGPVPTPAPAIAHELAAPPSAPVLPPLPHSTANPTPRATISITAKPSAQQLSSSSSSPARRSNASGKNKNLSVRNKSVLAAQDHFGNRYVGHLDLAGSTQNDAHATDSPPSLPQPPDSLPPSHPANDATASAPTGNAAPANSPSDAQRHSAISGSILTSSAKPRSDDEDNVPPEFVPPASAANASPIPRRVAPSAPAPSAPASVATTAQAISPPSRFLQIALPASAKPSYINLPGEEVVQSSAVTMRIKRAVLAPPATPATASANSQREASVRLGQLVSHIEPWRPRLTEETGARVSVRAILGADGRVERLMPVNGAVALVSSAVRAVRDWRFEPTLLAGKPVQTAVLVVVEFHPLADGPTTP